MEERRIQDLVQMRWAALDVVAEQAQRRFAILLLGEVLIEGKEELLDLELAAEQNPQWDMAGIVVP